MLSKESTQKIEIMYFLHPSYYNNALAHIYPQLSVYYPIIQELAKKILGDTIIIVIKESNTTTTNSSLS